MSKTALLILISGIIFLGNSLFCQNAVILKKGDAAHNFIEVDDDENEINLESYRGKVVLLNFTTTYCGPCWKIYSPMNALQKKHQDELKIISIHMDQDKELWEKMAKKKGITFEVSNIWNSDQRNELYQTYGANGFPYFVLINHDGIIVKKWFGNLERKLNKNLKKAIKKLNKNS